MNKRASIIAAVINIIGIACLIFFAVPYLTHDVTVPNPDAMLPVEAWDGAGMALTAGVLPLLAANGLGFALFKTRHRAVRLLFWVPGILCLALAASYWVTSLT